MTTSNKGTQMKRIWKAAAFVLLLSSALTADNFDEGYQASQYGEFDRAIHYYELACTAKDWRGCHSLGTLHQQGLGTPKDAAKAAQYYQRACNGGNGNSCFFLGNLYNNTGYEKEAKDVFRKACDLKVQGACQKL